MIDKKTKTITGMVNGESCDVEYEVTQFPAMQGVRIAVRLAKMFGGGVGDAGVQTGDIMNMDVGKVVGAIVGNLDAEETSRLIAELLSKTSRKGVHLNTETIDKIYSGNYMELLKALQFVLEVNFGGFFGALTQGADFGNVLQQELSAESV